MVLSIVPRGKSAYVYRSQDKGPQRGPLGLRSSVLSRLKAVISRL